MSVNAFPASISAIIQNGILYRTFEEALKPQLLYRNLCTDRPFQGNLGETTTFTRTGLLTPVTTPLSPGNDPSASTYSVEQYSMTLSQYGNSMDTNMLTSATALASKFLEDNKKLAFNAGQSLNRLTRDKMYNAYLSGNTRATNTAGTSSDQLEVDSVLGFTSQLVNGVQTPVSVSNPINIKLDGVANTITAVDTVNKILTLGTATTWAAGKEVKATNAPTIMRAGAKSTYMALAGTDVATLALFLDAVAYLRQNNVPTFGGYYVANIDPITERQLFADADFKQALQGRVDSPIWGSMSIGRFAGIDWVRNTEAPTVDGNGGVTVRRPCVCGADCCIEGTLQNYGSIFKEMGVPTTAASGVVEMVNGIALIHRPPLDKLQQVISSTWAWVGDFAIPTDATTGGAAQFKRCVCIEHAS